jgi:hypothetical protein
MIRRRMWLRHRASKLAIEVATFGTEALFGYWGPGNIRQPLMVRNAASCATRFPYAEQS